MLRGAVAGDREADGDDGVVARGVRGRARSNRGCGRVRRWENHCADSGCGRAMGRGRMVRQDSSDAMVASNERIYRVRHAEVVRRVEVARQAEVVRRAEEFEEDRAVERGRMTGRGVGVGELIVGDDDGVVACGVRGEARTNGSPEVVERVAERQAGGF
jgi:hypothetical protein